MISVNEFVRHSSVWSQVAPTLEQLLRWVNANTHSFGGHIPLGTQSERNSLIAETAFRLAAESHTTAAETHSAHHTAEESARQMILRLPRGQAAAERIRPYEWESVTSLSAAISQYLAGRANVEFSPVIPGCGVVDQSFADVISGEELIEIKSVKRPFRSSDYRQAITYAAMLYASNREVFTITLLNPRLGDYATLSLDQIAAGASGQSRVQLLQDLVRYMISLQVSA